MPAKAAAASRAPIGPQLRVAPRTAPWPAHDPRAGTDPRIEALVNELIGRVADKWTMMLIELLAERGTMRFTELARAVPSISQKMLTQTLRLMERDGLVVRTVHPVVPPRVEYALTPLGLGLGDAFCGVWVWAAANLDGVEAARERFDRTGSGSAPSEGRQGGSRP